MKRILLSLVCLLLCSTAQAADITTDLRGHWKFLEGTGTTVADASGNSWTLTLTNGPTWTTGPNGKGAVAFDGTDDYATSNVGTDLRDGTSNDLTLSAWFYLNASGRNDLFNWKSSDSIDDISIATVSSSGTKLELYVAVNGSGGVVATSPTSLSTSTWYHVCVTKVGNTWTIYLNGVSNASGSQAALLTDMGTNALWIGSNHTAFSPLSGFDLDGRMADVRAYRRGLSADDAMGVYNYGRAAVSKGRVSNAGLGGGLSRTSIANQ